MTYVNKDDQDMDNNELGDFYEEGAYEDIYYPETFGERVDSGSDDEEDMAIVDEEEMIVERPAKPAANSKVEEGFGEAINPDSNPHINDQLEDDGLSSEAEADYESPDSPGLMTKARQKLDEWTDKDERE
jgi:hypothetical protein